MDTLRKLTTIAAIVGAATFSAAYMTGCDEGYEADGLEGIEGVGEDIGDGVEDAGDQVGEGIEDMGDGVQ